MEKGAKSHVGAFEMDFLGDEVGVEEELVLGYGRQIEHLDPELLQKRVVVNVGLLREDRHHASRHHALYAHHTRVVPHQSGAITCCLTESKKGVYFSEGVPRRYHPN